MIELGVICAILGEWGKVTSVMVFARLSLNIIVLTNIYDI
jgi:hypothetical protein